MSGLGTDVLAVTCILAGAAVSGTVTVAALARGGDSACAALEVSPHTIVVTGSRDGMISITPSLRVHGTHGCAAVVIDRDIQVRMDEVRARVEEARARAEEAQRRVEDAQRRVEEARARAEAADALVR